MKKLVGYVVAVVGLVVMALGFNMFSLEIGLLEGLSSNVIAGAGIAIVVVGVILSMKGSGGRRAKQAKEEVPIYEGVGKKRKIVGYRRKG